MIKFLAMFLMVLDHTILFFFPDYLSTARMFTTIGFPLFAFMGVQGLRYTSDRYRFFISIFICCALTQPVFSLLFSPSYRLNDLFSILFGLLIIHLYEQKRSFNVFYLLPFLILMNVVSIYIFLVFIIYFFEKRRLHLLFSSICFFLVSFYFSREYYLFTGPFYILFLLYPLPRFSFPKYFFYAFYPAHFFIISFFLYI